MSAPRWSIGPLALAAAACSAPTPGELIVAIQTDMAVPKDLDHIELQILSAGTPIFPSRRLPLGPDEVMLPATQGLLVSDDPGREISIRVRAIQKGRVRVEHSVVTTVPEDRVATLWVPLHFLCSAEHAGLPSAEGVCPEGQTCFAGACRDDRVSSALLPDYVERDVLAPGACFDVAGCFRGAARAEVDRGTCTIAASDEGEVNVAIATEADGACSASDCLVPLDAEGDLGFRAEGNGRIALPRAVCALGMADRVVVSPVTAACPAKRRRDAICAAPAGPIALAALQRSPASLAVSKDAVFWTEQGSLAREGGGFAGDGAVKRVGLHGGALETLAKVEGVPRQVALVGDQLFWTSRRPGGVGGALMQRSVDRDDPDARVERQGLMEGLATNGTWLFWTELSSLGGPSGRVVRAWRSGESELELDGDIAYPYQIAAADNVACWTDHGASEQGGEVSCLRRDASQREKVSGDAPERTPQGIALDAKDPAEVFWVRFGGGEVVRRSLRDGGITVLASGQGGPYGVALDEHRIYWTNYLDGTVMALPRGAPPGTPPERLASNQRRPAAIAVDAGAIYWINEGSAGNPDGAVVRLEKPPLRP